MRPTIVLCCLVLFAGAGSAAAQESAADSTVYAVKYRKAKELAGLLERQFQGAADVRVVEDAATNQLLLSGPKNKVDASLRALAQLDRKPLTIAVEAFLFTAADEKTPDGKIGVQALAPKDFAGPAETVAAKIQTLKEQKHILELQRIQMTAQEHQRGNVKQMEQKPVVRGKTVTATGIVTESRTIVNIGVIMEVTPRLTPEREVMLDLSVEWSRLNTQPDGLAYASVSTFSGPVAVATGQSVLVRAVKTTAPLKDGQSFVVITAKIVP